MPKRLSGEEEIVQLQFKAPISIKQHLAILADEEGDGDMSSYLRMLIRAKWREREARIGSTSRRDSTSG